MIQPKLSIIIPIHDMQGGAEFLWRSVNALAKQTFKDFEIIITSDGKMAENTNAGIKRAHGEYIKILYLDDFLTHENALMYMVKTIDRGYDWLICGANNNSQPYWTEDIETGNNKLGSPSALMFRNYFEDNLLFDERMSWLLDCDLYKQMYEKHGPPIIIPGNYVTLGVGDHQMTNILTNEEKLAEHELIKQKYE